MNLIGVLAMIPFGLLLGAYGLALATNFQGTAEDHARMALFSSRWSEEKLARRTLTQRIVGGMLTAFGAAILLAGISGGVGLLVRVLR